MAIVRWVCTLGWVVIGYRCAWIGYSNYNFARPDERLFHSVPFLSAAAMALVIALAVHSRSLAIRILAGLLSAVIGIAGLLLLRRTFSSDADSLTRELAWLSVIIPTITFVALFRGRRAANNGIPDNSTQ